MEDRMLELNRFLNEGMRTRGSWEDSIHVIDVPAKDMKKAVKEISELAKAADKLGLDWILWGIGQWEAGGEAVFGTPIFVLKGRTLYYQDRQANDKLFKVEPENSQAKIQFSLVKRR